MKFPHEDHKVGVDHHLGPKIGGTVQQLITAEAIRDDSQEPEVHARMRVWYVEQQQPEARGNFRRDAAVLEHLRSYAGHDGRFIQSHERIAFHTGYGRTQAGEARW